MFFGIAVYVCGGLSEGQSGACFPLHIIWLSDSGDCILNTIIFLHQFLDWVVAHQLEVESPTQLQKSYRIRCWYLIKVTCRLLLSLLDCSSCANNPPEIDEVMELIKKTWVMSGINQFTHNFSLYVGPIPAVCGIRPKRSQSSESSRDSNDWLGKMQN